MTVEEVQKQIVAEFDFERVKTVMTAIDWKWSFPSGDFRVPTEDEMKSFALRLVRDVIVGAKKTKQRFGLSSGGFSAIAYGEGDKVTLEFVVESGEASMGEN
jgi:hypothetical protein